MNINNLKEVSNNLDEVIELIAILNNKIEKLEMQNNNICNCKKDKFYSYLIREQNILLEEINLTDSDIDADYYKEIYARYNVFVEIINKYLDIKNGK